MSESRMGPGVAAMGCLCLFVTRPDGPGGLDLIGLQCMETSICLQPPSSISLQGLSCLWFACRCEASIAKLSGDISIIRSEVQRTDKEIYGLQSALKNCAGDFEKKVSREAHSEIPGEW